MRADLTAVYNFLMKRRGEGGADLFFLITSGRIQGDSLELCQGKFRLDIKFFTVRVVRH